MDKDLLIVGGGPAGAAAAITAQALGLRTIVLERDAAPRERPGETAHPGIEPLLARLGVRAEVLAENFVRHEGHFVTWADEQRFERFGADANGPWRGFQLWRPRFDAILLAAAERAGADVVRPCPRVRPRVEKGCVAGADTPSGKLSARFVIDATGWQGWLSRALGLRIERPGAPLIAWYGYLSGDCPARDEAPAIAADAGGWTWTARIRPRLYQWMRLANDRTRPARDWQPEEFAGLSPLHAPRGVDVSWRAVHPAAGPGYFLVGDAAFVLDPASSHGMLKALMSGMMAAHLAADVIRSGACASATAECYDAWLAHWFRQDCEELRRRYAALGGAWSALAFGSGGIATAGHRHSTLENAG